MSDTSIKEIIRRPRRTLSQIEIPGDVLIPRKVFARDEIGVCERTATRMNLETVYVGGVAFVARNASLKIIADQLQRRNQQAKRRAR
jgi:hypothetical protein